MALLKKLYATGSDNTLLVKDALLLGPRDHQKLEGSLLTSYIIDHDKNFQIHVQFLLGFLQPVHLSYHSNLIIGHDLLRHTLPLMCTLTKTIHRS